MKSIEKEMEHLRQYRLRSWAKLISRLKRQVDEYIEGELVSRGYGHFKLGYMPLLMNIDPEGVTNTELSKRAWVSKQAMSKIVLELNELKYIHTTRIDRDGRSSMITLTDKGKRFVVEAKHCMIDLSDEYRSEVGTDNFEKLLDMLLKIIKYNEDRKAGNIKSTRKEKKK